MRRVVPNGQVHRMNDYHLKKQLLGEIHEALRIKELSVQLMEQVAFIGLWLLKYCQDNNIKPPNLDRLEDMLKNGREFVRKIDDKNYTDSET